MIYLYEGVNSDSHREVNYSVDRELLERLAIQTDRHTLFEVVNEARVIKSDREIHLMQWIVSLSCQAHVETMKLTRPGMREY